MADFNKIWESTLLKEGGYQNNSSDSGNYCDGALIGTKYGVSAIAYKGYFGKCPTVQLMKNLTKEDAKKIWKSLVWDKIGGDSIKNQTVAELMLDSAGGGANGYLHIRQAINDASGANKVAESKVMALKKTEVEEINRIDSKKYADSLYKIRLNYFTTHKQYDIYGKGWIDRLNKVYNSFIEDVRAKPMKYGLVIGILLATSIYIWFVTKKNK